MKSQEKVIRTLLANTTLTKLDLSGYSFFVRNYSFERMHERMMSRHI